MKSHEGTAIQQPIPLSVSKEIYLHSWHDIIAVLHLGGALSNAKGALSSWWNNISMGHEPPSPHAAGLDEAHEVVGEEDDMVIIGVCNNDTTKISTPKKAKS